VPASPFSLLVVPQRRCLPFTDRRELPGYNESMSESPILIISGTNRPRANSHRIARILLGHYQAAGAAAEVLSLCDLPADIFHPDAYARKPADFLPIQERVLAAPGLHVITPEYNGSFPGVLKYFIDMLKFPESFDCKPVAFVGAAAGAWGAMRAVEQLQMIFAYRNAHVFPARVFIPKIREKLSEEGHLAEDIDTRLAQQARGFAKFIGWIRQQDVPAGRK
jgi:chromate reductase, NAD(P)H dehydrogenase (quinone)